MTATSVLVMLSGCFVTLFIWARCTTVVCLVDEKLTVPPARTTGYNSTGVSTDPTHGKPTLSFECGNNSQSCIGICILCSDYYGGPTMDCLSSLFENLCLTKFESAMASLNSTDWCIWSNVRGLYSNLSLCTERMSDCLQIPWPNPLVEQTFVNIHSKYFKDCPAEELSDPPSVVIFALVVTPICLIPIMVSLVVLKTKNGDGSS